MVSCPKSVIAPTAAAGPLSVAKLISTWTKVCATVSRMASARSRAGRGLVSKSTVMAAPPYWPRLGVTAMCCLPTGHVHRAFYFDASLYNAFDQLHTERCAISTRGNNDGRGPAGWSQPALSMRSDPDRRDNPFHRDQIRSHRVERLTEHANASK